MTARLPTVRPPLFDRMDVTRDPRGPRWAVRANSRAKVITLQRHCRPDRDLEWEAVTRAELGDNAFSRQYGLNWAAPLGEAFYPDGAANLAELAPGVWAGWYVRKASAFLDSAPILVGHDFGLKRNGCILAQYDDPRKNPNATGILWYMRELRVERMVCAEVCALVRYMTGRASLADLKREQRRDALARIEREGLRPWLSPEVARRHRFLDYGAAHEKEIQSGLAPSLEEVSWNLQYKKQGVHVRGIPSKWSHGVTVMEHLLREGRVAGVPRMLIDPSCVWWLGGLAGGLVVPTKVQKVGGYARDEMFEDVGDMAHYIAQAVYRSRDLSPLEEADRAARAANAAATPTAIRRRSPYPGGRQPVELVTSPRYARLSTSSWTSVSSYDPR